MLPKLRKAERPPPDFSSKDWHLIRSFNITRTNSMHDAEVDLKYIKLKIHNCVETPVEEKKYGINTFLNIALYRFLSETKAKQIISCAIKFFNEALPTTVLVGFENECFPALSIRSGNDWYYREHIRGIEIFPNQQVWDKNLQFEDAALRITGVRGEEGIYLIVKNMAFQESAT